METDVTDGGTAEPPPERDTLTIVRMVLLWLLTATMAALIGLAGLSKFTQPETWTSLFESWGYPPSVAYLTGVLEVGGAAALLVPRLTTYAAALLIVVMSVAAYTVLAHPGEMALMPALVNIGGLAIVAYGRRRDRWRRV